MNDAESDRLCWGTLTRLPVKPPGVIDKRTASGAMLSAPMVGAVLGIVTGAVAWGIWLIKPDTAGALLAAVISLALLAWLTRAIHLDGLADTADALGSGKPADEALAIARKSDIGPFGVITLVFVLLIDIAALTVCITSNEAMFSMVIALVAGRLMLPIACMRGIKAARPDGLGATVADSVPRGLLAAVLIGWTAIIGIVAAAVSGWDDIPIIVITVACMFGGLACGVITLLIARKRLGGITGDVLGAVVEIATAGSLVLLALT